MQIKAHSPVQILPGFDREGEAGTFVANDDDGLALVRFDADGVTVPIEHEALRVLGYS